MKSMMNDKTPTTKTNVDGKIGMLNHGRQTFDANAGQMIIADYGLDRSTEGGQGCNERICSEEFNGGVDNLDHSIKGTMAHQRSDTNGRSDTTKTPTKIR